MPPLSDSFDFSDEAPLVSCIMPTADRRRFVPLALDAFLRQDYPRRELIVLDDGADAIRDLMPEDDRIRYVRLDGRASVGTKRNRACELARGTLIAHWDDDDWSAPQRLRMQVEALQHTGLDVCGLDRLFFCDPGAGRAWQYRYPGTQRPWVAGGTLLYRRAVWESRPFDDVSDSEDTRFVWDLPGAQIHVLNTPELYVARIHSGNTSPKLTHTARWHPQPISAIRDLMGGDWSVFAGQVPSEAGDRVRERRTGDCSEDNARPPQVTVSLPYFACKPYVRRAVTSILKQTYDHLRLVVINDGDPDLPWPVLDDIDDPRLVRFDLRENRGRYFADAVVLAATADPYFLVQDADDWSEPTRLETLVQLLRRTHADAALSAQIVHMADGRQCLENFSDFDQPLQPRLRHRANHHGLFRTDALRRVGGYDGGFRIGYDTLLVNLLRMTGPVAYSRKPLYHRRQRSGSLTAAPETGLRSRRRAAVLQSLSALYDQAFAVYRRYVGGRCGAEVMEQEIRALVRTAQRDDGSGMRPDDRHEAVEQEAKRLRALLAGAPATASGPTPARPRPSAATRGSAKPRGKASSDASDSVPSDLPESVWTLSHETLQALASHLEEHRPRHVLEVGSGSSTVVLARYAEAHAAQVTVLEHDPTYAGRTDALLRRYGLREVVDLHCAPLRPFYTGSEQFLWYDIDLAAELDAPVDFALIDGPPLRHGREAVIFALARHLADGWTAWLDDGFRTHEVACLHRWAAHCQIAAERRAFDGKGLWIIRDAADGRPAVDVSQAARVACTILTGQRPRLLRATVESLQHHAPGFLDAATVVVLVNGPDAETRAHVRGLSFVDQCLEHDGPVLSIGTATSRLMEAARALPSSVDRVLHLEDDWYAGTFDAAWLSRALSLLDTRPGVGQVRLRDDRDAVLPRHMVTGTQIQWAHLDGDRIAQSAHFTFNPSLIRRTHLDALYPCADEADAQRRFLRLGLATVQLVPGVFTHLGDADASLRQRMTKAHATATR